MCVSSILSKRLYIDRKAINRIIYSVKVDKVTSAMALQAARDSSVRSIRNISAYSRDEQFEERSIEEIKTRCEYLQSTWQLFCERSNELIDRARENGNAEDEVPHQEVFDQIEGEYLETRVRLQSRLTALERVQVYNEDSEDDRFSEEGIPNGQGDPVHNNEQEHEQPNGNQNIQQNVPIVQNQQVQVPFQFPMPPIYVQCQSENRHRKIENTWGEFDGTLSSWQGFHDRFKAEVHDNGSLSPAIKFRELFNSLKGKAKEAIGDWQLTDSNYFEAWDRLKELFARKYLTSKELLAKFNKLPKLERAKESSIQHMSNKTNEVIRSLKGMGYPVEQFDVVFVHGLHDRLDEETSRIWEMQRQSETPTAKEMLKFLDMHAKALAGAHALDSDKSNDKGKRPWPKNGKFDAKKFKGASSEHKEEHKNEQRAERQPCKVCNENHPVHKCDKFRKMSLAERKNSAREHNLCYNCLHFSHSSRDCKSTRTCPRHPGKKHNSLLCPENPFNRSVNVVQKSEGNVDAKLPKGKKNKRN